ncbi:MAG: helix-turn-helix transcriptional regulator [Coriobacteriales bacterium]|jgi:DNA-binding CsgD family transcriptional regulator|nr:helix-turn-helix transcriptional regulator [Coriobacteriales bacterium]
MNNREQQPAIIKRQKEGSVVVDFFLAIGVLGYSFALAWLFLLFSTSLFSAKLVAGDAQSMLLHVIMTLGVIGALGLAILFSGFLFKVRPALPILAIILSLSNLWIELLDFFPQNSPVYYLTWALTGVGLALLVLIWSEFVASLKVGQAKLFFGLSACLAALWLAGYLVTAVEYRFILVFAMPFSSLMLFLFLRNYDRFFMNLEYIDAKTSLSRMRLSWKPVLSTAASSCALGFSLSWLMAFGQNDAVLNFVLVLFVFIVAIVMVVDTVRWRRLGENFMVRSLLLFAAIGMLPLLFISDVGKMICSVILICSMVHSVLHGLGALSEHINLFKLSPMYTFAIGRIFSYLGILFGFVCGYAAFWLQPFGESTLAVVIFTLILFFIAVTVLVKMENSYPIDDRNIQIGGIYAVNLEDDSNEDEEVREEPEADKVTPGLWRRRCEGVAAAYNLTSRQTEVLMLLAKGRNADYITQELVISLHTAKAHIYNIYQKMGVHSRQEPIDIIEDVRLDI